MSAGGSTGVPPSDSTASARPGPATTASTARSAPPPQSGGRAVIRIWLIRPRPAPASTAAPGVGQVHVHLRHGPIPHDDDAMTEHRQSFAERVQVAGRRRRAGRTSPRTPGLRLSRDRRPGGAARPTWPAARAAGPPRTSTSTSISSTYAWPPASTTPAAASTSSCSGVRARASWAPCCAASATARADRPDAASSGASSAAGRGGVGTVRMVPATGRATARRAATATVRSSTATARPGGVERSVGLVVLQGPADAGEHLGEDRARSCRAPTGSPPGRRVEAPPVDVGHRLGDAGEGQLEVGAGVGVGDGEDVHRVQRVGRLGDDGRGAPQPGVVGVPHAGHLLLGRG